MCQYNYRSSKIYHYYSSYCKRAIVISHFFKTCHYLLFQSVFIKMFGLKYPQLSCSSHPLFLFSFPSSLLLSIRQSFDRNVCSPRIRPQPVSSDSVGLTTKVGARAKKLATYFRTSTTHMAMCAQENMVKSPHHFTSKKITTPFSCWSVLVAACQRAMPCHRAVPDVSLARSKFYFV